MVIILVFSKTNYTLIGIKKKFNNRVSLKPKRSKVFSTRKGFMMGSEGKRTFLTFDLNKLFSLIWIMNFKEIHNNGCDKTIFLIVRMHQFFFNSGTIDILFLVYLNLDIPLKLN